MKRIQLFCVLSLLMVLAGYEGYAATAASAPAKLTSADCLACHSDASMVNGKVVHGEAFQASVHGSLFSCTDCHTDVKTLPHNSNLTLPKCSTCHAEEATQYAEGNHGKAFAAGNHKAPTCEICHGDVHAILPATDPRSPTARVNIPLTCGKCHSQPIPGWTGKPAVAYQESVHGRLLAAGNTDAAVCSDCHSNHDNRGPSDPASPVYQAQDGRYCREYQATIIVNGQPRPSYGTACLEPDGSWHIVSSSAPPPLR